MQIAYAFVDLHGSLYKQIIFNSIAFI